MPNDEQYEHKTVQVVRGLEARTRAKWERDGWEFLEQKDGQMLRSSLSFRRPKKQVPRWAWVAGGGVAAALVAVIAIGAITEGDDPDTPTQTTAATARSAAEKSAPAETPSAEPVEEAPAPAVSEEPAAEETSVGATTTGLTTYFATGACNDEGERQFPHGFDGHTILGMINAEVQGESYFLKYEADITNAFGVERKAVVECTVTGTDDVPLIVSYNVN